MYISLNFFQAGIWKSNMNFTIVALLGSNAWCEGGGKGLMLTCNVYWIVTSSE